MPHIDFSAAPLGAATPPPAPDGRAPVVAGFAEALADAQSAAAPPDQTTPLDAGGDAGADETPRATRGDARLTAWLTLSRLAPQLAHGQAATAVAAAAARIVDRAQTPEAVPPGAAGEPGVEEAVHPVAPTLLPAVAVPRPFGPPTPIPMVPAATPTVAPPPGAGESGGLSTAGTGGIKPPRPDVLAPSIDVVVPPAHSAGEGPAGAGSIPGVHSIPGPPEMPGTIGVLPPGEITDGPEVPPPGPSPVAEFTGSVDASGGRGHAGGAPGAMSTAGPGIPTPSADPRPPGALPPLPAAESATVGQVTGAAAPGLAPLTPDSGSSGDGGDHGDHSDHSGREVDRGAIENARLKAATSMTSRARSIAARFKANEQTDTPVAPALRIPVEAIEPGRSVVRAGRDTSMPTPLTVAALPPAALSSMPPAAAIGAATGVGVMEGERGLDLQTQIVQAMRVQWGANGGDARIRLQPNYLGELMISLKVENGGVVAHLAAATPEVRQWIETNEATLRQGLAQHDLKLERLVVTEDEPSTASGDEPDTAERDTPRDSSPRRRRRDTEATFEVVV